MKRIFQLAIRVYPADWRKKYGTEFQALLDDVEPSWRAVFDVLQGGVHMRLKHINLMKLTMACAIAGALIAVAVGFSIKDSYLSSTLIQIPGGTFPDAAKRVDSLNGLIDEYGLYKDAHGNRPADVVHRMREDITVRPVSFPQGPPAFSVSYLYTDRPKAQVVVGALIERLMAYNARTNGITLEVLDAPSLPETPVYPNRLTIALVGLTMGGIVGAIVGLSRLYWRPAAHG
jgi:hypothetical protein